MRTDLLGELRQPEPEPEPESEPEPEPEPELEPEPEPNPNPNPNPTLSSPPLFLHLPLTTTQVRCALGCSTSRA